MSPDVDTLILGGGCAGLSLGQRLAELPQTGHRTLILEARETYQNDRAWCFWRLGSHRHDSLVSHSWSAMRLGNAGRSVTADCRQTPYQMLHSGPFYAHAVRKIAASPSVKLLLACPVASAPIRVVAGWKVETATGPISAREIIDTRPPQAPKAGDALLWQSFIGQEVECERAVFDPHIATLMDFAGCLDQGVLFFYVLPVSKTRALIETTVFGPRPLGVAALAAIQAEALQRLCKGAAFETLRNENAILPMGMTVRPAETGPGYVRAGLMTGGARPSTGYAFQRIQRWADASALAICDGKAAFGHRPDPYVRQLMDWLFLHVLRAHPERGAELFMRIFGTADTARVIRFLSDAGSLADCAAVVATLPTGLFLRELWRGLLASPALQGRSA